MEQDAKSLSSCREHGLVPSAATERRRADGGFLAVRLYLGYLSRHEGPDELEGIVEDVTELRALEPVDLNDVIRSFAVFLGKVGNLELKMTSGVVDAVQADPRWMEPVLMNLC